MVTMGEAKMADPPPSLPWPRGVLQANVMLTPPVMLNGLVRILLYRDIRLGKMKFLLPVIETFSKNLNISITQWNFSKIFQIMVELDEL